MTPIEHYREAERVVHLIDQGLHEVLRIDKNEAPRYWATTSPLLALAQVHATLANAHMTAGVWNTDDE